MFESKFFFEFAKKNDRKRIKNGVFNVNFKISKRHPHFYGHYWIPRTQKHGYRHQNRDSSYARAQVIAKYVITTAAILNVS